MKMFRGSILCVVVLGAMIAGAAGTQAGKQLTLLDLPISATNNAMHIASVTERPWWNEKWAKRAPLLVAGQSDVQDDKVVVDAIIDLGEPVRPEEVRLVTPWEEAVPCVAEEVKDEGGQGKVRLLFKTSLRPHQNKPFLVYFGNPDAKAEKLPEDVTLETDEYNYRVRNGAIDVVFDRRHVTEGLVRSLRIPNSTCKTVLFDRATGYAKEGFVFRPNAKNGWDKGTVVLDSAFAKEVRFDCADATVTFTLYAEQPRIDWKYELKRGDQATIGMNWGIGTGTAWDDFFYCGRSGKILTQRAGLDFVTDSMPVPQGDFQDWLGEGWYAFGERRMADIAGLAFDVNAVFRLRYSSYYGNATEVCLGHRLMRGEKAMGSGAIVATLGNVEDYRKIVKRIEKPVAVSVGAVQARVSKPLRIPRLDADWCVDHDVGFFYGGDSGTAEPLPKDPDWARTICRRLRSYGSTTVCVVGYPWWMMPIRDKSIYDRLLAMQKSGAFESWVSKRTCPTWEEMQEPERGAGIVQFMKAIHEFGMGVHTWCGEVPGWPAQNGVGKFMPELNDLAVDMMCERVKCGQDCAYSNAIEGELLLPPEDLVKKNGSGSYWTWKDPQEAFDAFDRQHALVRAFYKKFKARHPDIPVFLWNSEDGEIMREMLMSEDEGYFDTMVVEMLPAFSLNHTKHVAKRMRSHFNNRAGHTVWHHYYIMNPKTEERIWQIEWPFLFGVNGYSQETLTYETKDLQMSEVTADFFRFAEYTRLGEKVARMAPVKNVGVYRDPKSFRADVLKKRLKKPYGECAQQDGRVRAFSEIRNFNYDVIGPRFFTAKDLAQYRVVYIPEDDVLSESEVKEALAYVRQGGSLVIEGVTVEKLKSGKVEELKDGVITPYGKGKIVWLKEVKTDRLAKRDGKVIAELRKLFDSLGGVEPYTLTGSNVLDGNLQAGPEGVFLGLYNSAQVVQSGVVTLNPLTLRHFASLTSLFALDVKTGERQVVSNGMFKVSVLARNTGYYLIGGDAFTAVPTAKSMKWMGAGTDCFKARSHEVKSVDITGFKPTVAVEFVRENAEGKPIAIARSTFAKYDVRAFTAKSFDAKACKAALAEAKFIHFVDAEAKDADLVFSNCAEELRALLRRGGTILLTRTSTGTAAQAFLKDVDVFDPNPYAERGVGDTWATWCGPDDHPYLTAETKTSGVEPKVKGSPEWWNWRMLCDYFQYGRVFAKWDESKQQRLFRPKNGGEGYAGLVVQKKVLGAGRVIFNENQRCFTDWYESRPYGNNWMAIVTGEKPTEHAGKVTQFNGGEGDVYQETRKLGW